MTSLESILNAIPAKRDAANQMAARVCSSNAGLFGPTSIPLPRSETPELGLIRLATYLYTLYLESGRVGLRFVAEKFPVYNLDSDRTLHAHVETVRNLRTYFQHNLDPADPHDAKVVNHVEAWLKRQCGRSIPVEPTEWSQCLEALAHEAARLMETLEAACRAMLDDESRAVIAEDWKVWLSRAHSPEAFDAIIEEAAADIGRASLDTVRFRRRHYDAWTATLSSLAHGYDFQTEARRFIERDILAEFASALPLDGRDIMTEFGVDPGPTVGWYLEQARLVYTTKPCSRGELLETLRTLPLPPGDAFPRQT